MGLSFFSEIKGMLPFFNRASLQEGDKYRHAPSARQVLDQGKALVATPEEYVDWLESYMKNGGSITSVELTKAQDSHHFHILRQDIDLPSLPSGSALNLIVPEGIHVNRFLPGRLIRNSSEYGDHVLYVPGGTTNSASVPMHWDTLHEMEKRPFFKDVIHIAIAAFNVRAREHSLITGSSEDLQEARELHVQVQILLGQFNDAFKVSEAPAVKSTQSSVPNSPGKKT